MKFYCDSYPFSDLGLLRMSIFPLNLKWDMFIKFMVLHGIEFYSICKVDMTIVCLDCWLQLMLDDVLMKKVYV